MPALDQGILRILFGGQAQQGGDGFAAIFAQLMEGMGDGAFPMLEAGMEIGAQDSQGESQDAKLMAMELLSGLFLQGQLPDELSGISSSPQLAEAMSAAAQAEHPLALLVRETPVKQPDARPEERPDIIPASLQKREGASLQGEERPDRGFGLLQGQAQFQNAVSEAKKNLGSRQIETAEVDVEALQSQVSSGKFQNASQISLKRALSDLDAKDLTDQVKTGIRQNLADGKGEFVVKLRPDGMGEITVKLVEKESRMTLSIVASSPQVAKLLANEAAQLQSALRPLQVEVREIAAASQPFEAENNPAQMSFGGQQFTGHQQFAGQGQSGKTGAGFEREGFIEALDQSGERAGDGALNAYI